MVEYNKSGVVITVSTPDPHGFVHAFQTVIINMVQSLLSVGGLEEGLALDSDTRDGCRNALEVVKATLADPEMLLGVQILADRVVPPSEPLEE